MKNLTFFFIFCHLILAVLSCDSTNKSPKSNGQNENIDSFESALPHGSALANIEMSDEDKLKLAKAIGKEAILITLDSLKILLSKIAVGGVYITFGASIARNAWK